MQVQRLIELLQRMDPEAQVIGAFQPGWPITGDVENALQVQGKVYIGVGNNHSDYLDGEVVEKGIFVPNPED